MAGGISRIVTASYLVPRPSGGYRTLPVPENGIYRWTAIASLTRKGLLKAAAVLARSDFVNVCNKVGMKLEDQINRRIEEHSAALLKIIALIRMAKFPKVKRAVVVARPRGNCGQYLN